MNRFLKLLKVLDEIDRRTGGALSRAVFRLTRKAKPAEPLTELEMPMPDPIASAPPADPGVTYIILLRDDLGSGKEDTPAFGRFIIGDFECGVLEDSGRLVPAGEYEVVEDWHHPLDLKRRYRVPELQGVPGRSQIQIHIANYPDQLDGCMAPGIINRGLNKGIGGVERSAKTLEALMKHIKYPCRIRIHDPL